LNLYQPSKYFEGTVAAVYFVIELPDAWGPVNFYQTLGLVNASAFNKISLGNGYTAYLYNIAPQQELHLITLNRKPNEVHKKNKRRWDTHYRGVTRR
jgi:hypothetical protein